MGDGGQPLAPDNPNVNILIFSCSSPEIMKNEKRKCVLSMSFIEASSYKLSRATAVGIVLQFLGLPTLGLFGQLKGARSQNQFSGFLPVRSILDSEWLSNVGSTVDREAEQ